MHGELGVQEVPLRRVEGSRGAGGRVDAAQQPLQRRHLLAGQERHQRAHPDHGRPGSGDGALDPLPLDRVEVAAVPRRRRVLVVAVVRPVLQRYAGRAPGPRSTGNAHAWARASTRPDSSLSSAWRSDTVRPGRSTDVVTVSGSTGTGPSRSIVNRPIIRGVPSSIASSARPSSAAGGPPCWAEALQGPAVAVVERRGRPRGARRRRSRTGSPCDDGEPVRCRVNRPLLPISGIAPGLCILLAGPRSTIWVAPL